MDKEYKKIVKDILDNKEFNKLKEYKHHGLTRYDHVLRVSYWSYNIAKKLRLDYKSVARAGLLHDFFFVNNQAITLGERIKVFCNHPKKALENSKKYFNINKQEEKIILSHMFPANLTIPTTFESWLVNIVDTVASIYDRLISIFNKKR